MAKILPSIESDRLTSEPVDTSHIEISLILSNNPPSGMTELTIATREQSGEKTARFPDRNVLNGIEDSAPIPSGRVPSKIRIMNRDMGQSVICHNNKF